MIAVTTFANKSVLVFGLGGSGLATALGLVEGGAKVLAFDDNEARAKAANDEGIETANFRDVDFSNFDALILSPGVPLTHPEPHWSVKKAHAAGIEIIGDIELFNRERLAIAPDSQFVAITGTNGKSTTTALIAHILSHAGLDVQMGGNIGRAVLTLDALSSDKAYVVECSSYQIDLAPTLQPSIGVHLNISADHLDRHGTVENYSDVKARLVLNADHAIIGVDDDFSVKISKNVEAKGVSLERVSVVDDGDITVDGNVILAEGCPVADVTDIASLRGQHNLQNAAMAYAVCRKAGLHDDDIQAGLASFPGLAHRMEQVAEKNGVVFVNDSKATNADAAAHALASFDEIYWILGGLAKDGGIENLNDFFPRIMHAFLVGEATDSFADILEGKVAFSKCGTIDNATKSAVEMALSHVVENNQTVAVLLSPACASWDQFVSFEKRGDAFKDAVRLALK
ncbi:MAG: UDP-N-acetylmuramoyl-L-alanine--D-glutamate ligase [Hyphomicrobiales bacterium]